MYEIVIKAPAAEIWRALTDRGLLKTWCFDIADFELQEAKTFNFYEPGDAKQYHHQCTIKAVESHKVFSHTWTHPSHSKGESLLTWL
ncbi:SRPBCC family protein [Flavobacterium sp. JP2137]|uniref:SRPBCC family protein n=1 Tax=Flavobacterium sp. JP2137 TaxID=3414510 RepID=UPI003D2FB44B